MKTKSTLMSFASLVLFLCTAANAQENITDVFLKNHESFSVQGKQPACLYDSIYRFSENTVTNQWDLSRQEKYAYDVNNNLKTLLTLTLTSGAWVNSSQSTYTYDANNNMTKSLTETWVSGAWENSSQGTYNYDANNNDTSMLYETWVSGAWVNSFRSSNAFQNNNMTSSVSQYWASGAWVNSGQSTYTYDANNNMKTSLFQYWLSGAWTNSQHSTYTYDANSNNDTTLNESWIAGAWSNGSRYTYTYINNLKHTHFFETWTNGAWAGMFGGYIYYCANSNCVSSDISYQAVNGTTWEKKDSSNTFCSLFVNVTENENKNSFFTISPNPSIGIFSISNIQYPVSRVEIYNVTGECIYKSAILNPESLIDLRSRPKGMYFISINSEKGRTTKKLIIK